MSLLFCSELDLCVKERFWAPVFSMNFRFLHLLKRGVSAPMTSTNMTNAIRIPSEPARAGGAGFGVAASGVLADSEGALAVSAGVGSAATGVVSVSAGLAAAADVAAAAA